MTVYHLPPQDLSVRQPWAWAIVAGHKPVENRDWSRGYPGLFFRGPVSIHAAKGMTRDEYDEAAFFMATLGILCPRPDTLARGAIIGAVTVEDVVKRHSSPWFFGPRGLILADARQVDPLPAAGSLGFFTWRAGGAMEAPLPWMTAWPELPSRRRQSEFLFSM